MKTWWEHSWNMSTAECASALQGRQCWEQGKSQTLRGCAPLPQTFPLPWLLGESLLQLLSIRNILKPSPFLGEKVASQTATTFPVRSIMPCRKLNRPLLIWWISLIQGWTDQQHGKQMHVLQQSLSAMDMEASFLLSITNNLESWAGRPEWLLRFISTMWTEKLQKAITQSCRDEQFPAVLLD